MNQVQLIIKDNFLTDGVYRTHYIDTYEGESIKLNYSIKDIRSIDGRSSSYSKSIKMPGTPNNHRVFTHIFEVNAQAQFDPNKKADCALLVDTVPVMEGYFQLISINVSDSGRYEYQGVIYGEYADLTKIIGDKYLVGNEDAADDLSFDDLDHIPNLANVIASWSGNADLGYIYPMIDFGFNWTKDTLTSDSPLVVGENLYPCIYLKGIVDKIFAKAGFSYTSSFFDSAFFKKLFIVGKPAHFESELVSAYTTKAQISAPAVSSNIIYDDGIGYDKDNHFGTGETKSGFTPPADGAYTFVYRFKGVLSAGSFDVSLIDDLTNTAVNDSDGIGALEVNNSNGKYPYFVRQYNLTAGRFYYTAYQTYGLPPKTYSGRQEPGSFIGIYDDSLTTDLANFLPDKVKQIDILKSITKMFNLYIEPDKNKVKNLVIEPRDDYYGGGAVKDWTGKIDGGGDYELRILSELSTKKFKFSYKEDSDVLNTKYVDANKELYGSFEYELDNDFTDGETVIQPLFSPTPVGPVQGYKNVVIPKVYKENTDGTSSPMNEIKPRLLLNGGAVAINSGSMNLFARGQLQSISTYPYTAMYEIPAVTGVAVNSADSLLFGNINPGDGDNINDGTLDTNLFDRYYSSEVTAISSPDAKLLKADFYLTPLDINQSKLNDRIFLSIENSPSYWRINKISDYDAAKSGLTRVELIKLDDVNLEPVKTKVKGTPGVVDNIYDKYPTTTGTVNTGKNVHKAPYGITNGYGNSIGDTSKFNHITGTYNEIADGTTYSGVVGKGNIVGVNGTNIFITGENNVIGEYNAGVTIMGNDNTTGDNTGNVTIVGNNNIVNDGLYNVTIYGDGITATASDTTYQSNISADGTVTVDKLGIGGTPATYTSTSELLRIDGGTSGSKIAYWVDSVGSVLGFGLTYSNLNPLGNWMQPITGGTAGFGIRYDTTNNRMDFLYNSALGTGDVSFRIKSNGAEIPATQGSFAAGEVAIGTEPLGSATGYGLWGNNFSSSQDFIITSQNGNQSNGALIKLGHRYLSSGKGNIEIIAGLYGVNSNIGDIIIRPGGATYYHRMNGSNGFFGLNMGGSGAATAMLHIKGSGSTSATSALKVQNSSNEDIFTIKDDKNITFSGKLEITGTSSTFTPPKLTTAQITALTPTAGMVVYNTDLNQLQTHNGSGWQALGDTCCYQNKRLAVTGTQDGSNTSFSISEPVVDGSEMVFKNGLLLEPAGEDYTYDGDVALEFSSAPRGSDKIVVYGTVSVE